MKSKKGVSKNERGKITAMRKMVVRGKGRPEEPFREQPSYLDQNSPKEEKF